MTSPASAPAKQPKRPGQGLLPFWLHQAVEYAIAIVVASSGARLPHPTVPIVAAVVLLIVVATADGPLAAAHLVGRPKHRWVDLAYGIVAVVVAGALYRRIGSSAAIVTGLAGVAVLALSWRSSYALKPMRPPRQPRWTRKTRSAATATKQVSSGPLPPPAAPAGSSAIATPPVPSRGARAEAIGRKAGRYTAVGVKVWKNRKRT